MAWVRPSKVSPKSRISVHFPPDHSLATTLAYSSEHFLHEIKPNARRHHGANNPWISEDEEYAPSECPSSPSIRSLEKVVTRRDQAMSFRRDRPISANIMPNTFVYDNVVRNSMMRSVYDDGRSGSGSDRQSLEQLNRAPSYKEHDPQDENVREDGVPYPTGLKFSLIVLALCLAVFIMALDNAIIATAIPSITNEFKSVEDVGWYGSAYMLTTSALQLLFGKLYTFWSIKWVFLIVVMLFELGSLICGVAQSSMMLIIGRAVAGMGGAGIFAGALTIMAYTIPLRKRPLYTGVVGSMWGVSAVAGPLLGGVFAEKASWRWCFFINLPIGFITIAVVTFYFKDPDRKIEPKPWKQRFWQLDPIGTICFMPCIICILLALHWGGNTYEWNSSRITSLFLVSAFLFLVFVYVQIRMGDDATVPPRIFKKRSVWSAAFFQFFIGAAFLVGVYFLPIWFQSVKGTTAIGSGIRSIPLLMGVVIFSIAGGAAVTYMGYYTPFLLASGVLAPIAYGLISTLKPESSAGAWVGYPFLVGLAVGIGMQQPLIAVQVVLDMADVPTGTSLIIFHEQLGGALFLSAGDTILNTRLKELMPKYAPNVDMELVLSTGATKLRDVFSGADLDGIVQAYSHALQNCFWLVTAVAGASAVAAVFVEWKSVKGKKLEMA